MTASEAMHSINPATGELLRSFAPHSAVQIDEALQGAAAVYRRWRRTSFEERASLIHKAADLLRRDLPRLAGIITAEMGKPIVEAEAEIEKCAAACAYYADNSARLLADEARVSTATESYIQYTPLGVILAIMPWNFPFWQVFRFAAPALMAGNTAILKHASNVPLCALAIEDIFQKAGFPEGTFRALLVPGSAVAPLIESPQIAAVTLTGSEAAQKDRSRARWVGPVHRAGGRGSGSCRESRRARALSKHRSELYRRKALSRRRFRVE